MSEVQDGQSNKSLQLVGKENCPLLIWLLFAVVEGFVAIFLFFRIPGVSEAAYLGGFSKGRIAILAGLFGSLFFFLYLTYNTWRSTTWAKMVSNHIQRFLRSRYVYGLCIGILLPGVFFFSQLFYFSGVVSDPYVKGYLVRLRPLLFWISGILLQTLVMLPLFRYGFRSCDRVFSAPLIRRSALVFLCLVVFGIFIAITGIGIEPDIIGWDGPGTPILVIQVGGFWAAGILFMIIETWSQKWHKGDQIRIDLLVSFILWGFAYLLWTQEPITADYFAPVPRAPNYEIYPYSDAALHDVNAQELLIGEGFPGISRKPLYVLFLALLHTIGGQNYTNVISLQVGVLAFLPVFIYWLTKGLHSRLSGFMAAGLIILRERNAISLSGDIRVSHSKLMMSDMPSVLAIVLLTWLVITWFRAPTERKLFPIWIGGVIGLLMLLRPQFSLLIPLVPLMILLTFYRRPLLGIANFGLVILGLLFTLSPWLWRSYQLSGTVTLNDPNQMAFLTEQYHLEPQTESLQLFPGETISEFNKRINTYIKDFIFQHPSYVAGFITAHFLHNEIEMIQVLPMSPWIVNNPDSDLFPYWSQNIEKLWKECCSIQAYVFTNRFWDPWLEAISSKDVVPVMINLAIISLGLSAAWQKNKMIGWFPLIISLVYSFSTAIGRYSGWRLILPADWVLFLYFSIGLAQGIFWLRRYYQGDHVRPSDDEEISISWKKGRDLPYQAQFPWSKLFIVSLVLFGFGLAPLVVEASVPKRYQTTIPVNTLSSEFSRFSENEIQEFLTEENAFVVNGRALYPRFYLAREGEPGESWSAFLVRDYPRLGFFMVGPLKSNVILPLESSPDLFPNASDVVVLGCLTDFYLDAAAVMIRPQDSLKNWVIYRDSLDDLHCPLTSP